MVYCGTSPDKAKHAGSAIEEGSTACSKKASATTSWKRPGTTCWAATPCAAKPSANGRTCSPNPVLFGLKTEDPSWSRRTLQKPDEEDLEAAAQRHLRPQDLRLTIGWPEKKKEAAALKPEDPKNGQRPQRDQWASKTGTRRTPGGFENFSSAWR